mmetsp:Transcript_21933/g.39806  ORF Transcript_21933/g.39806 Transcript_21933/m.39806 type:complete len:127 (+) Transcript_21933:170-550(+)
MPPLLPLLSASAEVCRAHFYTSTTNRSTGSQHATYNVSRIDTFIDHRFQHETGIDRYCHRVHQGIPPKTEALRQTIQHFFISNISTDEPGALPSLIRVNKGTLAFENVTLSNSQPDVETGMRWITP